MKTWTGIAVAVLVVGVAAVFAATLSGEPGTTPPAWVAPAGYSVVDTVVAGDDTHIRLWVNLAATETCSLVEETSATGEHRGDFRGACSPPATEWSTSRGLGVMVFEVPADDARAMTVTGPDGAALGPLAVHHRLAMLRDHWEQRPVNLTVRAWRSRPGDLGPPAALELR
jgi:hypothetical protein